MKKFITILLVMAIILSMTVMAAAAETTSGSCGDTATWSYSNGTLTISGTGTVGRVSGVHPWKAFISDITTVVVEEGITRLDSYCFTSHTNLVTISLPDSLESMGRQIFQSCDLMTEITLPKNLTIFKSGYTPLSAASIFCGNGMKAIYVHPENPKFYSVDGVLFDRDAKALLCYPQAKSGSTYTVPAGIEVIGEQAMWFTSCTTVYLPEGLKTINSHAFSGAKITSIQIPDTVTTIDVDAFWKCNNLTELTIPAGVTKVGRGLLNACAKLEKVTILNTSLAIPDDVNFIPSTTQIHGYVGSTAEDYAKRYGRTFVDLETGSASDYYVGNAGFVALLPADTGSTYPVFNRISSYVTDTGVLTGYQPSIIKEEDTSNPTYQEMLAFVNELTAGCATDYEKAEKICRWVNDNMTYEYGRFGSGTSAQGIYALWKYRASNCEGYTQLNNFLLHLAGIPNGTATGYGHCWSVALVEDGWIMIDSTNNIFAGDHSQYDPILRIEFVVNDNLVCVIDDLMGVKLSSYGTTVFQHALESELTIPGYITHIYDSVFLLKNDTVQVIHGTAGSYTENYLKENLPRYDLYTYKNGMFTASISDLAAPTLSTKGFSLSYEDEILLNLYLDVTDAAGLSLKDMGLLVWDQDPGTANISTADEVFPGAVSGDGKYMVRTEGISAKRMGDSRFYAAYAKLSDGSYIYTDVLTYSPKQYAMNRLASSTDSKLKALCVAMLNYGAAAQEYFGYRTDDLMNADLTASQQALVMTYDASLFAGAVAADESKAGTFARTAAGFSARNASVSFDSAFAINYYFTPDNQVNGDLTLYYWSAADYDAASTLTADNATGTLTMQESASGSYFGAVTGIAAKKLDDTYYVAAIYTDADGNTCCTGVIAYSLSKYCMRTANSDMGALAQATAMYGYHAKAYFG